MSDPKRELREFTFHQHIRAANDKLGEDVLIPPGDDMGMVKIGGEEVLAAVDQCVVGRHCRPDEPLRAFGRKAVLRNLSDVAAMAARPARFAPPTCSPDPLTRPHIRAARPTW